MKVCIHCKRELPETAFSKSNSSQDGLQGYCKECSAQYRRIKRSEERERRDLLKNKMFGNRLKWKKVKNPKDCWKGEARIDFSKRRLYYENYYINLDKLFNQLPKEE